MKKYIGVDGIIKAIGASPAQVCDGLLYVLAHELSLDLIKLEEFIERKHPDKYDSEDSIRENCERAFGKEITEQIEYSLKVGLEDKQ